MKRHKVIGSTRLMQLADKGIMTTRFSMARVSEAYKSLETLPDKAPQSAVLVTKPNGVQVLENAKKVTLTDLWQLLTKSGLYFRTALKAPYRNEGLSITVVHARDGVVLEGGQPQISADQILDVMKLFRETWEFGHAWHHQETKLGSIVLLNPCLSTTPGCQLGVCESECLLLERLDTPPGLMAEVRERGREGELKGIAKQFAQARQ